MGKLKKVAFFGYLAFLTALLLVPDPTLLVGGPDMGWGIFRRVMPVAHLLSFAVLAILALTVRWPLPRWLVAVGLIVYGGLIEIVQSFLPPRTAEWEDWLQDIAGVAIGAILWWGVASAAFVLGGSSRKNDECMPMAAPEE
jgi:hypothetical protein